MRQTANISFLILFLCLALLSSCHIRNNSKSNDSEQIIDSLIEIIKLNDQTILLRFGADAITAIHTQKGIVIIDAGISTGLTKKYSKIIEQSFPGKYIEYVVNTHGHPDHYGGNSVFQGASVIANEAVLQEIADRKNETGKTGLSLERIADEYDSLLRTTQPSTDEWKELFTQKIRYSYAYVDAAAKRQVKEPDSTFTDSLTIFMGDVTLEMYYFGKSHSNSDIIIFIPELKTLFTGDLFTRYGKPGFDKTRIENRERCQQSVKWIEKRMTRIEKIITGHGQVLQTNDLSSFTKKIMTEDQ